MVTQARPVGFSPPLSLPPETPTPTRPIRFRPPPGWSYEGWTSTRSVVVVDVDHTLADGMMMDFLTWCFKKDPLGYLKRAGWRTAPDLVRSGWYAFLHKAFGIANYEKVERLGQRAYTRLFRGEGLPGFKRLSNEWWRVRGKTLTARYRTVHDLLAEIRGQGARAMICTSLPRPVVRGLARELGIPRKDLLASSLWERNGQFQLRWQHGPLKADAVDGRLGELDRRLRRITLHRVDRRASFSIADNRSDWSIRANTGIGNAVGVGPGQTRFLKVAGGERILLCFPEPDIRQTYRVTERGYDVTPQRPFTAAERLRGSWLAPAQWVIGDLVSAALYERPISFLNLASSLPSFALFSGIGSSAETLARGAFNLRMNLPFFHAGTLVRQGMRGGLFHLIGSLAAMGAMEVYHRPDQGWFESATNAVSQTGVQISCWAAARQIALGAFRLFSKTPLGATGMLAAETILSPILQFTAMKWSTDWDYRQV